MADSLRTSPIAPVAVAVGGRWRGGWPVLAGLGLTGGLLVFALPVVGVCLIGGVAFVAVWLRRCRRGEYVVDLHGIRRGRALLPWRRVQRIIVCCRHQRIRALIFSRLGCWVWTVKHKNVGRALDIAHLMAKREQFPVVVDGLRRGRIVAPSKSSIAPRRDDIVDG